MRSAFQAQCMFLTDCLSTTDERAISSYADVEEFARSSKVPGDCLTLSMRPGEDASDSGTAFANESDI